MVDVIDAVKRSALMSRVRSKNTTPELLIRKQIWHAGFRYSLHSARLPGKPDIVLPKWNAAVFVHGCFWHRHSDCPYFRLPKTRTAFWDEKLARNRARDDAAIAALVTHGWRVAVVWECAVRANHRAAAKQLMDWLQHSETRLELSGPSPRGAPRRGGCTTDSIRDQAGRRTRQTAKVAPAIAKPPPDAQPNASAVSSGTQKRTHRESNCPTRILRGRTQGRTPRARIASE